MYVVPKQANDMMNVGRLQGFEVRYITICPERPIVLKRLFFCCKMSGRSGQVCLYWVNFCTLITYLINNDLRGIKALKVFVGPGT